MPAAVVKDGTVTPKFRQGKISTPFLTAKSPPPCMSMAHGGCHQMSLPVATSGCTNLFTF